MTYKSSSRGHQVVAYGSDHRKHSGFYLRLTKKRISLLPTPSPRDIELMSRKELKEKRSRAGLLGELYDNMPPPLYEKLLYDYSSVKYTTPEIRHTAIDLVKDTTSQREALEKIYSYITQQFTSIYYLDELNLRKFIPVPASVIWERHKRDNAEPCHTQAIVLRAFLLASKKFKPSEVKFVIRWEDNVPHTFLKVYLRDERKWIYADPWYQDYVRGAKSNPLKALGKHA